MSVAQIAVSLFAADKGYLDEVALDKVTHFETELQDFMASQYAALMAEINEKCDYNEHVEKTLHEAIGAFKKIFV